MGMSSIAGVSAQRRVRRMQKNIRADRLVSESTREKAHAQGSLLYAGEGRLVNTKRTVQLQYPT